MNALLKDKYIAIDFDGTCVTHECPNVGKDIGAAPVLRAMVEQGALLILYTMRSDKELEDAVNWFKENGIELFGIQENPTQHTWTSSPKIYAHIYIDDAALGAPLTGEALDGPYINWAKVAEMLDIKLESPFEAELFKAAKALKEAKGRYNSQIAATKLFSLIP